MSLTLPHPAGGVLTVTDTVFETMWGFVQRRRRDTEAGGMLIGHHPMGSEDLILDRLTTPQPEDRRSRCRFHRDQEAHQELLDLQWILSGGKRTYLGEWHTHPEAHPSPSELDLRSWRGALRNTAFRGPGLVFVIVGTETAGAWFGTAQGHHLHLLGERAIPPLGTPVKGARS